MERTKPLSRARAEALNARRVTGTGPWRCVKCNVAIVPGRGDPCLCFPKGLRIPPEVEHDPRFPCSP